MRYGIVFLIFAVFSVHAEVYRWVDDKGQVVYTDEYRDGAEKVVVPKSMTYTPIEQPLPETDVDVDSEQQEPQPNQVPDYRVSIIAPADDENIWANDGNITVSALIEPQLSAERSDKIQVQLDGRVLGDPRAATLYELQNVDRGTHTVIVTIVDISGRTLAKSSPVTFHVHRQSVIN